MRLRNKKTGGIWDIPKMRHPTMQEDDISFFVYGRDEGHLFSYKSLAELNEEWEDYKPTEPLINNIPKDEKIRKAVRAWAEANDLLTFKVVNEHFNCFKIIGYGDHNISSRIEFKSTIAHANKDQFYTITELCGEEEE